MKKPKVESVEEFLARGGKITIVPPVDRIEVVPVVAKSNITNPHLMDLEEGGFYFSESVSRAKAKKYNSEEVDLSVIPPSLLKELKLETD